jgi:RimJ/RimL family protein N-acetyltransferase
MIARQALGKDGFRFELRPYDEQSAEPLLEAAVESKAHVAPWMAWLKADYSLDDARVWVREPISSWDDDRGYEFRIYDREDGVLAGCAGLNAINHKDRVANLGYWVRTSKLRLGAARQATELLTTFGFEVLELNRLEIVVAVGNIPSQRVAESVSAKFEGVQADRLVVGAAIHDARMYAVLRRQRASEKRSP